MENTSSVAALKHEVRRRLDGMLVDATGARDLRMQYSVSRFCKQIFLAYELALRGWPEHIVFQNLSSARLCDLRQLLHLLKSNPPKLYFDRATPEEVGAARESELNACPGKLFPAPVHRYENRNIGRSERGHHKRAGPSSAKDVDSDVEREVERITYEELSRDSMFVWSGLYDT
ncbi:hypothetical protein C8Q74DRAFT_1372479 [Fomes fomentarius]|nr:hypothetical protein C8Q74DRAFT_1372479 [Fomes fomentarius]